MKRTELKRRSPLRASAPAKAELPILKQRKCANCKQPFRPFSSLVKWCSPVCGAVLGMKKLERQKLNKAKEEAAIFKKKLADSKPLEHWLKLTERVVNRYILVRDREQPCISCGTFKTVQWEAGHYRNVGSYPEIRFDLRNITKQCHRCNCDLHGNKDNYRIGYVERNGQEPMDWLEGPHPAANYTRESLAQLRAEVRRMAIELEK